MWLYKSRVQDVDVVTQMFAVFKREPRWEESLVEWMAKLRSSCAVLHPQRVCRLICSLGWRNWCHKVNIKVAFWLLMGSAMTISGKWCCSVDCAPSRASSCWRLWFTSRVVCSPTFLLSGSVAVHVF